MIGTLCCELRTMHYELTCLIFGHGITEEQKLVRIP